MIRIRMSLALVALAAALSASGQAQAQSQVQAQSSGLRWAGTRNEQLIDEAVRHYGFRPNRLMADQVEAIQDTWYELMGTGGARRMLTRMQATAIVYMALVYPLEEEGWYQDGRPDRYPGRPGGGWNDGDGDWDDRPGGGWDNDVPPSRGEACRQMESDAYRLENLIRAPEVNNGLFVVDPEKGRTRALARQIQQRAVECRASYVADRAGEILTALAAPLPSRSDLEPRVEALKQAIRQSTGRRRGDY